MFAQKLVREARERAAALKQKLVELYNRLQSGSVTEEERKELGKAVEEIQARLGAETRRLCGEEKPARVAAPPPAPVKEE